MSKRAALLADAGRGVGGFLEVFPDLVQVAGRYKFAAHLLSRLRMGVFRKFLNNFIKFKCFQHFLIHANILSENPKVPACLKYNTFRRNIIAIFLLHNSGGNFIIKVSYRLRR